MLNHKTLEYSDDNKPTRIDAIVISTQHDFHEATWKSKKDIVEILIPRIIAKTNTRSFI
jgi:S-adenosylmethionine synthetase